MIIQFMIRGGVGANVVLGEGKARGGHDWESGASGAAAVIFRPSSVSLDDCGLTYLALSGSISTFFVCCISFHRKVA